MVRFEDLRIFVAAADHGSFSAAARELDLTPAVASAALKRLSCRSKPACSCARRAACG